MTPRPKPTAAPETEQSVEGAVRRSGPDPAKCYDGGPCKNCGETLRLKSNRCCVVCAARRQREKYRADPQWAESENRRKREQKREKRRTDPVWAERQRELLREWRREKYRTDPDYAERWRQWHRDRYDNDTFFRHKLLVKHQLELSARRLKEAEQRGQVQD